MSETNKTCGTCEHYRQIKQEEPREEKLKRIEQQQAVNQQATEPMTYQDNRTPQQNVMDILQADDNVEDYGDLPF